MEEPSGKLKSFPQLFLTENNSLQLHKENWVKLPLGDRETPRLT